MNVVDPPLYVPAWAIIEGFPEPEPDERFVAYCERIGVTDEGITDLLVDLTERTEEIANARLATYLIRSCPECVGNALARRWPAQRFSTVRPDVV